MNIKSDYEANYWEKQAPSTQINNNFPEINEDLVQTDQINLKNFSNEFDKAKFNQNRSNFQYNISSKEESTKKPILDNSFEDFKDSENVNLRSTPNYMNASLKNNESNLLNDAQVLSSNDERYKFNTPDPYTQFNHDYDQNKVEVESKDDPFADIDDPYTSGLLGSYNISQSKNVKFNLNTSEKHNEDNDSDFDDFIDPGKQYTTNEFIIL